MYQILTNVDIIQKENNYDKRFMLEMLHIVDIPPGKRFNYKTDIDNCSQSYKHLILRFLKMIDNVD